MTTCLRGRRFNWRFFPAAGGAPVKNIKKVTIRFAPHGCTNRPFYHIVVTQKEYDQREQPIEQVGTYDPMANMHNERLVSLNMERVRYWLGKGADTSEPVSQLLGIIGFFPIHPRSYMHAWRNRRKAAEEEAQQETKEEKAAQNN